MHAWFTCPEKVDDPDLITAYHELMSLDEKKKQARYRFAEQRRDSLITRAVARCVLSRYCTKKPHEWEFRHNKHGKPEIVQGSCDLPLKFNLSHTKGLVACVVALDQDVGIDVEYTRKKTDVSKSSRKSINTGSFFRRSYVACCAYLFRGSIVFIHRVRHPYNTFFPFSCEH